MEIQIRSCIKGNFKGNLLAESLAPIKTCLLVFLPQKRPKAPDQDVVCSYSYSKSHFYFLWSFPLICYMCPSLILIKICKIRILEWIYAWKSSIVTSKHPVNWPTEIGDYYIDKLRDHYQFSKNYALKEIHKIQNDKFWKKDNYRVWLT